MGQGHGVHDRRVDVTTDAAGAPEGSATPDPAQVLLEVAAGVVPGWLFRSVLAVAARQGLALAPDDAATAAVVTAATERLLADLADLLATDVDEQRTNPLSLFRAAVAGPTAHLVALGARPSGSDGFRVEHFPDDVFGIGPATWSDVDPALHEPGLTWGAWKAMTVLQRRRSEGRR